MSPFAIRDMEPSDRDAVIDLIRELNLFENGISGDRVTTRQGAAACLAANQRKVREHGGWHLVALGPDGDVAGYACCGVVEGEAYLSDEARRYGWIFELVVRADRRGRGIGEALVAACEDLLRAMDVRSVGLGVLAGNDGAARLYDRLGYRPHAVDRMKRLD